VFAAKRILDPACDVYVREWSYLVNCPKCGSGVENPSKTWPIPSREGLKEGEHPRLVGIFECPSCKARFRSAVETETELGGTANIKNMVERIKGIKGELMQTLMNLREKISTLETERASLMVEIENLRRVAESRVDALEGEVSMLRNEVKSLRDLLGYKEEEKP
jgi:DNA repair exonuclease SbcCD ATPase subunit